MPDHPLPARGLTVADLVALLRVSSDKVRHWIRTGELSAINTAAALSGKPRWIVLPDALAAFQRRRAGGPTPKSAPRKRRVAGTKVIDYYPEATEVAMR